MYLRKRAEKSVLVVHEQGADTYLRSVVKSHERSEYSYRGLGDFFVFFIGKSKFIHAQVCFSVV